MLDTPRDSETLFADHYVDVRSPHARGVIATQLRRTGLVTLDGLVNRQHVLGVASRLMTITPHPHAAHDRLTLIHDTGSHAHRAGFAGLGSGELRAHTEGSSTLTPPRLMLLVCLQPAPAGGETLLADGRAVHWSLTRESRDAVIALYQPRTVYFGAGTGHATRVFTPEVDGRVSIRLRQDGLARWSPIVQPCLPALRQAIAINQQRLTLQAGQGYLLDNHRWLHARTRFTGDRRLLRALGTPLFRLPDGFAPHPAAAALPRPSEPASGSHSPRR
ncbi:TauD/TfdA family dioxygenase [Streptomyces sp. 8L]|uniref:TauD/TfdA family dioxygenase n=1 Tax=Streptomyces sp. 8L TaxID=2877242 RepID=UPI001CD36D6A|nr:TauD/TfdA family dioxygenase [Streptomyces sp. 8L]MCA1218566.1 TauD/TfdA family dioxygenase [Streptomyces sp. 8L]